MRSVEDPAAGRLFGAHVAQGPEQVAAMRQVAAALEAGQAEVGDPEVARAVDQQVAGLDVAVQDAQRVGVLQGLGRLHGQPGRLARRTGHDVRRAAIALVGLAEPIGQRAALDELHGVVVHAPVAADREDRHDVGVVQGRHDLRLDLEPRQLPGVDAAAVTGSTFSATRRPSETCSAS